MKKSKGIKTVIFGILLSIFCISTIINTSALENSIKLDYASRIKTPYIGGVTFSVKKTTSGEPLYCLDMNRNTATNIKANLVGKRDNGITTIILNGYPNKSITGDSTKDYYITQSAVWWYLDETTGSSNLGEQFKSTGSDSYNMRSQVKALVDLGLKNKNKTTNIDTNNLLKLDITSKELKVKGDYYESELITIKKDNIISNIKVTLSNVPEKTLIVDENGNEIKDYNTVNSIYIKIPKSAVTSSNNYTLTIIGNYTEYQAYEYQPVDTSMQNVAKLDKETKEVSDSITLSTEVEHIVIPDTSTTSLIITIIGILVISSGIIVIKKYEK